ncbi:MAG: hypothetical protein BKP49_06320 [Treponema sp. CETP13]|nr:MAG: hypothetical protein BKP49_06320 [Treponema sp. CETP13]
MIKSVIISGNEYPATVALVQTAIEAEKNVLVSISEKKEAKTPENGALTYPWCKNSPISARSMLLKAESSFENLDCGFIFFDSEDFVSKFEGLSLENISRANDEMLLSIEYLTYEFCKRFEMTKKGLLCFVLNPIHSFADTMRNPHLSPNISHFSTLTSVAQAGFRSFAENISATASVSKSYKVLLLEKGIESRDEFAKWVISFADSYSDSEKIYTGKDCVKWHHIGAKLPASRSFFGH